MKKHVLLNGETLCHSAVPLLILLGACGAALDFVVNYYAGAAAYWPVSSLLLIVGGGAVGRVLRQTHRQSFLDPLTDLWNRRYFFRQIRVEMARLNRTGAPFCLLMVDVDNFKRVNDTYGHLAGDAVISNLAAIFRDNVRAMDSIVRWGGDEFAIILPAAGLGEGRGISERIRAAVKNSSACHQVTISCGLILVDRQMPDLVLLDCVDRALYAAKTNKNSTAIASDGLVGEPGVPPA